MAENQLPAKGDAPVLVPSGSSSSELSTSGASELHPFSLGRASSSSNLSSLTVPVRLDVLYFLLNSAAKGAQGALAPLPIHSGQGSVSACRCPVAVQAMSCCNSCHPTSRNASDGVPYAWRPGGPRHDEPACGNYGHHGRVSPGIPDRQNNKWVRVAQRNEGKSRSGSLQADSARGWKRSQSPLGWKEKRRDEGGRHGKGDNWQGKQMTFRKAWDNCRGSLAESTPWNSGSLDRKREGTSSVGVPSVNIKKNQGGSCWQAMCRAPEDQRHLGHTQIGWQKSQGTREPASFVDRTVAAELANTTGQDKREDWEAEYENPQETSNAPESISISSFQSKKIDTSKAGGSYDVECAPSADPPKQKLETSPLPKSVSKDQAATSPERELTKFPSDWSKNGRFAHYLQGLYSDMPGKSSSESSTDLAISTDAESSKLEEEEAAKSAADGESKPWE
ncbi:uncharacterized protein LOC134503423 [Candoia aspera]|uniref:uncharacterized protein LOC134503423 n=1 Tax=Candoia aspera TaxID=51853 RepID=UPI002FD841A3